MTCNEHDVSLCFDVGRPLDARYPSYTLGYGVAALSLACVGAPTFQFRHFDRVAAIGVNTKLPVSLLGTVGNDHWTRQTCPILLTFNETESDLK